MVRPPAAAAAPPTLEGTQRSRTGPLLFCGGRIRHSSHSRSCRFHGLMKFCCLTLRGLQRTAVRAVWRMTQWCAVLEKIMNSIRSQVVNLGRETLSSQSVKPSISSASRPQQNLAQAPDRMRLVAFPLHVLVPRLRGLCAKHCMVHRRALALIRITYVIRIVSSSLTMQPSRVVLLHIRQRMIPYAI